MKQSKQLSLQRRQRRTRQSISGRRQMPRLVIHTSLKHTYAQIVDDQQMATLAAATDAKIEKGTKTDRATQVGQAIAAGAQKAGVTQVILDRGAKRYHGRIKAVADAAREKGLRI